jgi:hypothetical protein
VRRDLRVTASWSPRTDQLMDAIGLAFLARPAEAAIVVLTVTCADFPRPTRVLENRGLLGGSLEVSRSHQIPILHCV